MANRSDQLVDVLDEFTRASREVDGAAVVSVDGLTMAAALPDTMEEDHLGAVAAALLGLGDQAAGGLGRGALRQVFVEGDAGYVFLMAAGDDAVLAAITTGEAKIGLMLWEMRQTAEQIGRLLSTGGHPAGRESAAHVDATDVARHLLAVSGDLTMPDPPNGHGEAGWDAADGDPVDAEEHVDGPAAEHHDDVDEDSDVGTPSWARSAGERSNGAHPLTDSHRSTDWP